jgi:polyhydroxyalkanoate synthase
LPLFLQLVREVAKNDPALARDALSGLSNYAAALRPHAPDARPEIARVGGACLRDHGGDGAPLVLIPSLINPPHILDLDGDVSLAAALAAMQRRVFLLDWGPAAERSDLCVAGHVTERLVPLLRILGEPATLIGYCLGGTMAIAAAQLLPVERVATLAAPWHFSNYPNAALRSLQQIWTDAQPAAEALGMLPMEVLQAIFWSLDPHRTVAKYARLAEIAPHTAEAARFVALEDWANRGEPLPLPAARELLDALFGQDVTGRERWIVGGKAVRSDLAVPALHVTAAHDRITPATTAPPGTTVQLSAGHVGMVVGRARTTLHEVLKDFLKLAA